MPGTWVDDNGVLHFSIPEMLAFFRMRDTAENREEVKKAIARVFYDHSPQTLLIERTGEGQSDPQFLLNGKGDRVQRVEGG